MIIAFCGTSASGKTALTRKLQKDNLFENKCIVIKEDNFFTINILHKIAGGKLIGEYKKSKFFKKESDKLFSKIFSYGVKIFYPLLVYSEYLLMYIFYKYFQSDKIIFFDRYVYDYVVTFENVLDIHNPLNKLAVKYFPKPDLVFYTKIDLKTSIQRNKNNIKNKITSLASFHEKNISAYSKIAKLKNMIEINCNSNLSDAESTIKEMILDRSRFDCIKYLVISGIDGSGKTTIAKMLCDYSEKIGVSSKVAHIYYSNSIYKIFKNLIGTITHTKAIDFDNENKKLSYQWAFFVFLFAYIQYLIARYLGEKKLIIFDRFLYDYLVDFKYRGLDTAFFENKIPSVSSKFIFLNKVESNFRKNEHNKEYFTKCLQIYKDLASKYGILVVNTDYKSLEQIMLEVKSAFQIKPY